MKLEFIASPTERTTAFTDLLMGLLAAGLGLIVLKQGASYKATLWACLLVLIVFSSLLGAVAHGYKMSARVNKSIWQPMNLALGLTVALFAVAVVFDLWGEALAQAVLPYLLIVGIGFYLITVLKPGTFLVFIIYEALAMLFALGGYSWLAFSGQLPGAGWIAAGVLVMIVAAAIQATERVKIAFIWQFDHNGVFHILQMLGLILVTVGLVQAL